MRAGARRQHLYFSIYIKEGQGLRRPVVRSGDAARRPGATPRLSPLALAGSLAARASPCLGSFKSRSSPSNAQFESAGEITFGRITGPTEHPVAAVQGRGQSLGAGPFRVTTIGHAFHWMDRDEVLRKLAIVIADGGGLALVNAGKRRLQESWEPVADQIVAKFIGARTRHPKSNPQEPEHEPALLRSEYFSNFTAHEFPSTVTRDINSIIGMRLFNIKFRQAIIRR